MSLNLYDRPLVECTFGINPQPVPDEDGNYRVRLGTLNENSLEGWFWKGDYKLLNEAMGLLVGKEIGEYRYARNLSHLAYVRHNTQRQAKIIKPYFKLLSYSLTEDGQKIHIDGVVQPLDEKRLQWVLRRNDGLIFSARSWITLEGYTKQLQGIISFDLEERKYIEEKLLWRKQ